ncbi:MAG: type IV pilus assembly protein FimV, partial [Saezia sp.]
GAQQQRDAEAGAQQQRDAEAGAQQQRDAEAAAQQQRDAEAAQQQRDAEAAAAQQQQLQDTPYVPQKDWIDLVLENLWMIAAGLGAVIVLVGGLLFLRGRKKTVDEGDDSFFEEEDSYYPEEEPGGDSFMLDQSSSIYAASQLDANADVDPVQEADVYLAYGRDEQAAEILRDALSSEPDRVALHAKLCEVYARQNDIIAFEGQAMRLHGLTKGQGFEWERISRLAQSISPNKIGMLGSDIPDTRSPITQPAPYNTSASQAQAARESADTEPMDFMSHEEESDAAQNDNFADLDVSLDFSKSLNPKDDNFSFSDSSSDAPSFAMDGDDDDEGPSTRLALAEEFFAIGNKEDAKEIIQEVMKQNISDNDKKRAASLLNKIS